MAVHCVVCLGTLHSSYGHMSSRCAPVQAGAAGQEVLSAPSVEQIPRNFCIWRTAYKSGQDHRITGEQLRHRIDIVLKNHNKYLFYYNKYLGYYSMTI